MKQLTILLLLLVVFIGVAAFSLYQRGLLTRDNLDLFLQEESGEKAKRKMVPQPVGLAASVQEEQLKLSREAEEMRQLTERLEGQREELAKQRALIEEKFKNVKLPAEVAPIEEEPGAAEEMKKLVKIYEGMRPQQAAPILDNLPDATVAQILLGMRRRQAAQIMGSLDAKKAAGVSKLLLKGKTEQENDGS